MATTSLLELHEDLRSASAKSKDVLLCPSDFVLGKEGNDFLLTHKKSKFDYVLKDSVFKHISNKFSVSRDLFNLVDVDTMHTVLKQVFEKIGSNEHLFRFTIDDKGNKAIRGILGKDYQVCDNHVITGSLLELLPDDYVISNLYNSDEYFYLRVVPEHMSTREKASAYASKMGLNVNDPIARGFEFSNSELGFKSVQGRSYLEVLRCTNGMTCSSEQDLVSMNHKVNRDLIMSKIHSIIARAPRLWDSVETAYKNAIAIPVAVDKETLIASVCSDHGVGQRVAKEIYKLFQETPLITAKDTWQGVCDVFTEFAHTKYNMSSPSFHNMESLGTKLLTKSGKYLELSNN